MHLYVQTKKDQLIEELETRIGDEQRVLAQAQNRFDKSNKEVRFFDSRKMWNFRVFFSTSHVSFFSRFVSRTSFQSFFIGPKENTQSRK